MTAPSRHAKRAKGARRQKKRRPAALRFAAATKYHGEVRAVGPVSLAVEAGQSVALLGHNGSGKSTLLAMAAGVLEPTDGQVLIEGARAGEAPARAAVSYLRDHPVLYEDLSVAEHLEYLTRLHGADPDTFDAAGLLARLGLEERSDDLPSTFSRGLRQKAAIAVALCRPYGVLLVDEPFAGLDPAGQATFLELLREARDRGAAVLVATHDLATLEAFDHAVVLENGDLVYEGPASDLPTDATPTRR